MKIFKDINFKYTDAEEEKLYAPELIDKAYIDINNVLENIKSPEKFLVIGPKGAGKTALSSKLQLLGKNKWNLFVDNDELEQFEFNLLSKSGGNKGESIGGALTVWQMILALRLIPLLLKDEHLKKQNPQIEKFHENLKKYGLSSSDSLISIIQYTSRRGIFGKLKTAISEVRGELVEEENYKLKDPASIFSAIKKVIETIKPSESDYYLVLDGLDHTLRAGKSNAPYIADLINAVRSLNIYFSEQSIKAKTIILIRDEVLQLVPDPNLTKRINDNGVPLKWYDNTRSPFETSLLKIIQSRAHLVGFDDTIKNMWKEWFPSHIHYTESFTFILNNTRHLPRDLISFFRELQKLGKEPPFREEDVLAALNNYSDWFLLELSDALVGLVNEDVRTELPDILSDLGRTFTLKEFKNKLEEYGVSSDSSAEQIARELFNTSWIGNVWETDKGTNRYSWKHRKINAKLNLKHKFIVHTGLWKTLNLV